MSHFVYCNKWHLPSQASRQYDSRVKSTFGAPSSVELILKCPMSLVFDFLLIIAYVVGFRVVFLSRVLTIASMQPRRKSKPHETCSILQMNRP